MSILRKLERLVEDAPPDYAFELSAGGVAWARVGKTGQAGFRPLPAGALAISPVRDNVLIPDALQAQVLALVPPNGKAKRIRRAALILPDYAARVAVLDFDAFPAERAEQLSLVRFRMKKTVPFDLESAAVSFHVQATAGKKVEVVVAVVALEILARYEAPFRTAGFHPGFVTTSMLAALELLPSSGLGVVVKLGDRVLTVAVTEGQKLKLLRCVELDSIEMEEVMGVLFPTIAYAEDQLGAKPASMRLAGFGAISEPIRQECESSLGVPAEPLRSRLGAPSSENTGLFGYLEGLGQG
jgi:type IV pilus assembly protein PilM